MTIMFFGNPSKPAMLSRSCLAAPEARRSHCCVRGGCEVRCSDARDRGLTVSNPASHILSVIDIGNVFERMRKCLRI